MHFAVTVFLGALALVCAQPGSGNGNSNPDCQADTCKNITITIVNEFEEPYFNHTVSLRLTKDKPLIYYLEQACIEDPINFDNFTVTFHHIYGYFVDAFNGVFGNWPDEKTYWQITNDSGPLQLGVSSYIPEADDNITFTLIQSPSGHDDDRKK